jgi:hypothetical protein
MTSDQTEKYSYWFETDFGRLRVVPDRSQRVLIHDFLPDKQINSDGVRMGDLLVCQKDKTWLR